MFTRSALICTFILAAGSSVSLAAREPEKTDKSAAAAPASGEKIDLRPKFKAGQKMSFTQKTVRKDVTTIPNMGGEGKSKSMETSVDQTAMFEVTIDGASAEGTSIRLELTGVKVKAEIPQGKYEWDSTSPPDDKDLSNPVIMAYKPTIGAITQITLAPDGNIKVVTPDGRLQATAPGPLQSAIVSLVGTDQVRLRWGTIFSIRDGADPVAVGGTWTNSDTLNSPPLGKFEFLTTNTLKAVADGVAKIDIAGEIKLGDLAPTEPAQGTVEKGTLSGSAEWDTKVGGIKTHNWKQSAVLIANASGIKINRSTDIDVTTTRTK